MAYPLDGQGSNYPLPTVLPATPSSESGVKAPKPLALGSPPADSGYPSPNVRPSIFAVLD